MFPLEEPIAPRGEDLPYDDGEPLESEIHRDQMNVLIDSLDDHWRDRQDVYIAGNMFVYYSETQLRSAGVRGPDVFVVLDTVRKPRKSWVVWEEDGRRPDLIIELLSASTESVDRGRKMDIYSRLMSVTEYYLFDPFSGLLEGYALDSAARAYRPMNADPDGGLTSRVLGGLRLNKHRALFRNADIEWLRWFTADGQLILHASERARAETERARAETQRARAETERARAETERADDLAARLAVYEAKFGPLPR